jgi:transposase
VWIGGLNPPGLVVERQSVIDGVVEVSGRVAGAVGRCPDCGTSSSSCHSRYVRTLSDLPISGALVKLRLSVRRFRCKQRSCLRKTFSEALAPSLGRRHGRRVARCDELVHAVGLALGGRPGSRMMARLAAPWSKDTLLRTVRRKAATGGPAPAATVIGIDDFAWRRGHSYGSIVVDLERRKVIDILPDRQRGTIVAWLKENRQVRVICRDRGPGYGAAAAEAAPQARQVADRWHLFENASAAFLSAVRSELPRLRKALSPETPVDPETLSKAERIGWEAAVTREAVNDQILALAAQGVPLKTMARTTGVSRQTIRKIVRGQRHDMFRTRQSSLDPWRVRLEAEWTGGCRNGAELWRRLQASGFAGSLRVVGEWATRRRRDDRLGQTAGPSLSARTIARGLTAERAAGSARIALVNATIETAAPDLIAARDLLDRFHAMMRSKDEAGLVPWIASAKHSKLASFAAGIEADRDAVAAAIVEPWSSGQVEGKVNRLKLIKRQMYGRANLDLLRARLMAAA